MTYLETIRRMQASTIAGEWQWKGWEYEDKRGMHMVHSKSHIFRRGETVALCGVVSPRYTPAMANEGGDGCKRCERIADKRGIVAD